MQTKKQNIFNFSKNSQNGCFLQSKKHTNKKKFLMFKHKKFLIKNKIFFSLFCFCGILFKYKFRGYGGIGRRCGLKHIILSFFKET